MTYHIEPHHKVLIVEDESLMQQRLVSILVELGFAAAQIEVAASLAEARHCIAQTSHDMVLVDIGLPDGNGVTLIHELHTANADQCALVISAWSTEDIILSALNAGATGYVLKERDNLEITLSIRSVLSGGAPIDPFIARRILTLLPGVDTPAVAKAPAETVLSQRESEILQLVAEGLSNREIAEQLTISRYTAECHIKNIYKKLAVSSRVLAINEARDRGLLG